MLVYGESPNNRKKRILENIKLNRSIISNFEKHSKAHEFDESLVILRSEIKENFNDLVELERWRKKNDQAPTDPYIPPSQKAYIAQLTADGELEDYMEHQADIYQIIDELKYELWEKNNQRKDVTNDTANPT